jgi:hypothetical protein
MDPGARPVQEWRKQSFDFTADSTKQLITVAAGVVTATVLFSKDLDAISRGLAYASWIALIFSVMFGIAVLFNLSGNLNNAAEGKYRNPSVIANDIRIFSVGQIGMFVLGIILICCFGYHAIQVPKGVEKTITVNCVMPPSASSPISIIGDPGHPSAALPMVSSVDYTPILRVVVLLVAGAALLVVGVRLKSFVPAFAGSAMLMMGLTPTVTNNFNIGEQFKIDVPLKPRPGTVTGTHTFKLIGLIMNFAPGCADLEGTHCKFAQSLRFVDASREPITRDTLFEVVCKEKEMVFVVGRTDRVRLGSNLRMQYESNVGLAQDRAESVKKVISNFCADQRGIGSQEGQGLSFPPLVTQVGGPRNTPLIQSRKDQSPEALANGDDRSVELDSIEEAVGSSVPVQEKKYPTWIGALALIVIVLLAVCMALGATHWSATFDFLKGAFGISGGRGRDEATGE